MSRRQYDTHDFDRQRYQNLPVQQGYMDNYGRTIPLTMSYADRPHMRSSPIATPVERHQLEADPESQDPKPKHRRRISMACVRCRKRKIKCSGDPGNGTGCQACRAAGSKDCTFFRVGSAPVLLQTEHSRNFDSSQAGMAILANAASYQQEYPTRTRFPSRLAASPNGHPSYLDSESPVDSYGLGPSTVVPNHDPYLYPMHDGSGRTYFQSSYSPSTYSESPIQEAPAAAGYSHSQGSYVDVTGARHQVPSDSNGAFNVESLQHSLPTPTVDRKLPMPAQVPRSYYADDMLRPRTSSGTTSHHYTMASVGYPKVPPANWLTENLSHDLPQRSSVTVLNNELMAPPASTISTSTASTVSEINSVSYAASASSSDDSPAEVESVEEAAPVAPDPVPTRSATAGGPPRSMYNMAVASSSEISLPRHTSTMGLYTYSFDKRHSSNDLDGVGVLVNGDEYEPIKQPPVTLYMPLHYPSHQSAPISATRYTLPTSTSHPNMEASIDGAGAHQIQRRPSIPSVSNS
ncbi:mucin-desulfating sulfatase (n-acetylglucosamine-6-sulfatase) [Venturia nashicola]|nr:mucin-desulfating sulfatase (n-acetylglucosamine-6-sulfatase) [Venturia nashicola]